MPRNSIRLDAYCPHCGNFAAQELQMIHPYTATLYSPTGEAVEEPWSTYIASCNACGQLLLYDNPGDQFAEVEFTSGGQLYPAVAWIGYPIPSTVSDPYSEAVRVLATSPVCFATKARVAITAICDDRGVPGGAIAGRIRHLRTEARFQRCSRT
jgi:hypothetical protein